MFLFNFLKITLLRMVALALLFSFSLSNIPADATLLEDKETVSSMIRAGVPAGKIFAARTKLTKRTVTDLIFSAAPCYPLKDLFSLYPAGKDKNTSPKPTNPAAGEDAFFNNCAKNPHFFINFFGALTPTHFRVQGRAYNPLEYNPLLFKGGLLDMQEGCESFYTPLGFEDHQVKRVRYTFLPSYSVSFTYDLATSPNLPFLTKLLDIRWSMPPLHTRKAKPELAAQLIHLHSMVPMIRGEVALVLDKDAKIAWDNFSIAKQSLPNGVWKVLLDLHLAELQLGVFNNILKGSRDYLKEKDGLRILRRENYPLFKLRLGQYYLGFFGHDIQEEKGFELLKEAVLASEVSHLALRAQAEYYLGITNKDALDLERAKDLLDQAFEACEGVEGLQDNIRLRRGEMALGFFNPEDTIGQTSPADVSRAIECFQKVRPDADMLLYQIYTGLYGDSFRNEEKASTILNENLKRGPSLFDIRQAMNFVQQGEIDKAVTIFERCSEAVMSSYYLGRIKSNPKLSKHFDPYQAVSHFLRCADLNFRDSRLRCSKLLSGMCGFFVAPDKIERTFAFLVGCSGLGKATFTYDELKALDLITEIPVPSETHGQGGEAVSPPETDDSRADEELPTSKKGEEEFDEAAYFREEISTVDETILPTALSNPILQNLYDQLGGPVKWKQLQRIVKAFGGEIDHQHQTIKLPHCEVFNFHRLHSGNPTLSLFGYWAVLKGMLDHEYNVQCQEEAGAMVIAD